MSGPRPTLASADLVDDVDIAQDTWTTTWRACFVPAARDAAIEAWEVQAVTAQGVSPRVQELVWACIDLGIG